jgi:hypothetical protein
VLPCNGALLYSRVAWPASLPEAAVLVYGYAQADIDRSRDHLRELDPTVRVDAILLIAGADEFLAINDWAGRQAARHPPPRVLGFVAAGMLLDSAEALSSLVGHADRAAVAAAGAKLIDSQRRQRGPLALASGGDTPAVMVAHAAGCDPANGGYFASLLLDREVFALQAGCLFAKAELFQRAGGWRRPLSDSVAAGVDLSLRLRAAGGRVIWSAQAVARSTDSALDAAIAGAAVNVDALRSDLPAGCWRDLNAHADLPHP